ncbi:MAG: hypothetical protein HYT39_01980 [Candidatus Sungbacteria bacterium]|nr:hypothetical protein [Candidatus Sungbacteria bacterium]
MKKFLIFLILIAALVAAYLWLAPRFTMQGGKPAVETSSNSPIPADWRVFNSEEFKLSFRYPPDWKVQEIENGLWVLIPPGESNPEKAPISVNMQEALPYERAVEEISTDLIDPQKREIKIGGYRGVRTEGMLRPELADGESRFSAFTMLDRAGRLVSFDYIEFAAGPSGAKAVYEILLSSLAFDGGGI